MPIPSRFPLHFTKPGTTRKAAWSANARLDGLLRRDLDSTDRTYAAVECGHRHAAFEANMDQIETNRIKPKRRWFQFSLKTLLLLPVFVGLPLGSYLYWDDWRKHRPPFVGVDVWRYEVPFWRFEADLRAGRIDQAYDSTSVGFKRRMSRNSFHSIIQRYPALQEWSEADWVGTHDNLDQDNLDSQNILAIAIRGPNGKISELWVWVAPSEDSIFHRRPPPPCVAEIQIREVAEDDWWKAAFSPELTPNWEHSREGNIQGNVKTGISARQDAVEYYDELVRLNPKDSDAYFNRGSAWDDEGDFEKALGDFNEAIRLNPQSVDALNRRAWIRATCTDARFRDGAKAVIDATKCCELTDWNDASVLSSLAAAYAELGDFDRAVEWQKKTIELEPEDDDLVTQMEVYQSGKAFREERW
jgi:tetratricopeptide (TPR) repeat protein